MPPERGLYAAAVPLLVAAPLASSPYLQTGPVAMTSLLTLGALTPLAQPGSDDYVQLGLLLALVVGAARIVIGLLGAGAIAYLMSRPMLMGFVPAAAVLIVATQLPAAAGATPPELGLVEEAAWTLVHPGSWEIAALLFSAGVLVTLRAGRGIHPLFPAVLVAVAVAVVVSILSDYAGPRLGAIAVAPPPVSLDLPWSELPAMLVSGLVIAVVGFAEPAAIARGFAAEDRVRWDADREFVSQGAANVGAGLTGGFPVGGSFSRSTLSRLAGAATRWSGALTGMTVLACLPFASVLEELPNAVLAAIVISAVVPLIRLRPVMRLWRFSRPQFAVAVGTFALTIALAPRVERAVVIGVLLSIAVHLWRELQLDEQIWSAGPAIHVRPRGVLWFGAAQGLEDRLLALLEGSRSDRLVLHLDALGRVDTTGALALRMILEEARRAGMRTDVVGVQPRDRRLVEGVVSDDGAGGHERDGLGPRGSFRQPQAPQAPHRFGRLLPSQRLRAPRHGR